MILSTRNVCACLLRTSSSLRVTYPPQPIVSSLASLNISPILFKIVGLLHRSVPVQLSVISSRRYVATSQSEDSNPRRISSRAKNAEWVTEDLLSTEPVYQPLSTAGPAETTPSTSVTENIPGENDDIFDSSDVHRPKYLSPRPKGDFGRKRKKASPKDDLHGGDVVFGTNPVLLALRQQRRKIYRLFITEAKSLSQEPEVKEILRICKERNIPAAGMQSAQLLRLSENRPHQGFCLDCTPFFPDKVDSSSLVTDMSEGINRKKQLWLFLDSVMDPMNLGAILRSGYFFGVDRFVLFNSCPPTSTVSKASAGVMEIARISNIDSKDIKTFFSVLKDQQWSIAATCSKNELVHFSAAEKKDIESVEVVGNTVLVIGNEHSGVNSDIIPFCDQVISIEPGNEQAMDHADCLNVSVATGVILSHIAVKRKQPY